MLAITGKGRKTRAGNKQWRPKRAGEGGRAGGYHTQCNGDEADESNGGQLHSLGLLQAECRQKAGRKQAKSRHRTSRRQNRIHVHI